MSADPVVAEWVQQMYDGTMRQYTGCTGTEGDVLKMARAQMEDWSFAQHEQFAAVWNEKVDQAEWTKRYKLDENNSMLMLLESTGLKELEAAEAELHEFQGSGSDDQLEQTVAEAREHFEQQSGTLRTYIDLMTNEGPEKRRFDKVTQIQVIRADPGFRNDPKTKHLLAKPQMKHLLNAFHKEEGEAALQREWAMFRKEWLLKDAKVVVSTHSDLELNLYESMIRREEHIAKNKVKRLLKSQVIISRLQQYANTLHSLKKDFQETGQDSESEEDDFNDGAALLLQLEDAETDEEEQEEEQDEKRGICGGAPAESDQLTADFGEEDSKEGGVMEKIREMKQVDFDLQGDGPNGWKEETDSNGKKYYYHVKNGRPDGLVRRNMPLGEKGPIKWYCSWRELAGLIGRQPRLRRDGSPYTKDGKPVTGLGICDELVQHIFFAFRKTDPDDPEGGFKVARADVIGGLSHLLTAGYGPKHKLMVAFQLCTPSSIEMNEHSSDDMTYGSDECLNFQQFKEMFVSLHLWCTKFNLATLAGAPHAFTPLDSKQLERKAQRMFNKINTNSSNHLITLPMFSDYANKEAAKVAGEISRGEIPSSDLCHVLGIYVGDEARYSIKSVDRKKDRSAEKMQFTMHNDDHVRTLVQVLDAIGAWQNNRDEIYEYSLEDQKSMIKLPLKSLPSIRALGETDLAYKQLWDDADSELVAIKPFYTEQVAAAYSVMYDQDTNNDIGIRFWDAEPREISSAFGEAESMLSRLMFSEAGVRLEIYNQMKGSELQRAEDRGFSYHFSNHKFHIEEISQKEAMGLYEIMEDYTNHMCKRAKEIHEDTAYHVVPSEGQDEQELCPRRDAPRTLLDVMHNISRVLGLGVIVGFFNLKPKKSAGSDTARTPRAVREDIYFIVTVEPFAGMAALMMPLRNCMFSSTFFTINGDAVHTRKFSHKKIKPAETSAGFSSREQKPIKDGMPEQTFDPVEWQLEKDAKFLQKLGIVSWEIEVMSGITQCNELVAELEWKAIDRFGEILNALLKKEITVLELERDRAAMEGHQFEKDAELQTANAKYNAVRKSSVVRKLFREAIRKAFNFDELIASQLRMPIEQWTKIDTKTQESLLPNVMDTLLKGDLRKGVYTLLVSNAEQMGCVNNRLFLSSFADVKMQNIKDLLDGNRQSQIERLQLQCNQLQKVAEAAQKEADGSTDDSKWAAVKEANQELRDTQENLDGLMWAQQESEEAWASHMGFETFVHEGHEYESESIAESDGATWKKGDIIYAKDVFKSVYGLDDRTLRKIVDDLFCSEHMQLRRLNFVRIRKFSRKGKLAMQHGQKCLETFKRFFPTDPLELPSHPDGTYTLSDY